MLSIKKSERIDIRTKIINHKITFFISYQKIRLKGAAILIKFILGFIFAIIGLPLLDLISDTLISTSELIKGKFAIKIADINNQILKINGPEEMPPTRVIGFSAAPTEEDDDEEN